MRLKLVGAVTALAALVVVVVALPAAGAAGASDRATYVVQMLDQPVVTYDGGTAGLAATKPAKGEKIDPNSHAVRSYADYLKGSHDKALERVGGGDKVYDYAYSYNGFAAKLTSAQADALAKLPNVLSVERDQIYTATTADTPSFLGLDATNGLWSQLGGPTGGKNAPGAGEGIIIGDIDSGITPESASFSDRDANGKLVYQQIPGWHGKCVPGEAFNASMCNQKLIGAQYFNAGFGGNAGIDTDRPWEFNSVRDYNGHGTHTASTAGGNFGVQPTGQASAYGKISGIAPRARIAAYKALWSTEDSSTASGSGVDLLAAIDTAVSDGVDVINYSISGTSSNFLDGAEIAFLNAADAGIFVSASAGNDGATASTVAHPSPWITTVAAETHDRVGAGAVTIDGTTYNGASAGTGSASGQLVTFGTASNPSATPAVAASDARLCKLGSLPAGAAIGKIVLCERGVNARIEKSFEVARVGGVGMILVNPTANSLNADLHFVPTVHLQNTDFAAITAAAQAGNKAASISGQILHHQPAPFIAAFSSRGPLTAGAGDLLKPDVGAPGVDVLAAVAPPGNRGREFDLLSGTSMSAPHVTGLAALLTQRHPDWSPMAIKSALMTTATDVLDTFTGTTASDASALRAFAQGAGHVQPNAAVDPGLVFDSDIRDWLAFLCGATTGVNPATCAALSGAGYSFDRSDMNTPSIAIGDLAGTQTVVRRVTNVGSTAATYTASASIAGVAVGISPSSFTIAPGATQTIRVTFTTTSAALNKYTAGSLTLAGGGHNVRIPLVIRPVPLAVPGEVTSTGAPVSWIARVGYTGPLTATVRGLLEATTTPFDVAQDPDQTFVRTDATGTFSKEITVPANTLFRVGIYEDAITPTGTDLDMYVYAGASRVGQSADGDSNEEVTLRTGSSAATLTVYVHGFSTNGPSAHVTLFHWLVPPGDAGNTALTGVAPAVVATTQTHTATFTGLAAGKRYLGQVDYSDGTAVIGRTIISVRTP